MSAQLFNTFRLLATKSRSGTNQYIEITELKMFTGEDGTGTSVLVNGVATASSTYSTKFTPAMAFDNNPNTGWSTLSDAVPAWIQYALISPVSVLSFYLKVNTADNGPVDFKIQGSNDDGATWTDIFSTTNFATSTELSNGVYKNTFSYALSGSAKLETNAPVTGIQIIEMESGELVGSTRPNQDGSWLFFVERSLKSYYVLFTGPSGFRPQAHGPVIAERLNK